MKKLLLTGIAVLLLATGAAHAVEIPKQYRGVWCATKWQTIYERCSDDSGGREIKQTFWIAEWPDQDMTCALLAIRESKYGGHIVSAKCDRDDEPAKASRPRTDRVLIEDRPRTDHAEVEEHW